MPACDRVASTDRAVSRSIRDGALERRDQPARRLRVMQVVLSLQPGGTERLVIEIAKGLVPAASSIVCCLDEPGAWASELTDIGVPVTTLGRRPGFHPGLGSRIAALADQHQVDLLHCHHYTPFVYGQIAGLLRRRLPVVFTEHGRLSDAPPSLKRRLVNPLLGRLPAAIFAVSHDLREHMLAEGLPARHVRVLHNGIAPGARPTMAARWSARQAIGLTADTLVIGTAGRLDPVKNLPMLIEAFAALNQAGRRMELLVIGDGPERSMLAEQAAARGVAGAVRFTGYRRDVTALLPAMDVYANTSTHEGVSLTILEAMSATLPVVATAVGGTPEVVVENETGLMVPSRSVAGLVNALDRLATDQELRRSMGEAGRFRVKRHFSVETMTAGYLNAYRQVLGS